MNNGERFARLFKGYTARYGRYDMEGATGPETKIAGKARTVDKELVLQDYLEHVEGKVGIGVIPLQGLAREHGFLNFAAIDIDVYQKTEQESRKLTHADVALSLLETPLIVTKSKSGGIHVWLFSEGGVSAKLATDYLKAQAANLGAAGTEVFPKQNERYSDEDVGNWINLPYFGDTRKAVIPSKTGSVVEFVELPLEQFLDIAEEASKGVTDDWLKANSKVHASQRTGGDPVEDKDLWYDGPPCLQRLVIGDPRKVKKLEEAYAQKVKKADFKDADDQARQLAWLEKQKAALQPTQIDGGRNKGFFNVGIYLRRRMNPLDPDVALELPQKTALRDKLVEVHTQWRVDSGNSGIQNELNTIAAQAAKGKWGYKCTDEPLKSYCDRPTCLKRRFGVGTGVTDSVFSISGFTIVNTVDKQYYLNMDDKRMHIPDVSSLLSQHEFAKLVTNTVDRVWQMMAEPKYKELIDGLLKNADVIEGPPDTDRNAIVLDALREFVNQKKQDAGKNDSAFFSGRVLWNTENTEARFKFDQFMAYLTAKGYRYTHNQIADMLTRSFGVTVQGNTHIGGRQARPYVVNLALLEELIGGPISGEA